jgi:hypothetical protein
MVRLPRRVMRPLVATGECLLPTGLPKGYLPNDMELDPIQDCFVADRASMGGPSS